MNQTLIGVSCWVMLAVSAASAQQKGRSDRSNAQASPPLAGADKVEVYRTVGDVKLKIYIYFPDGHRPRDQSPAIVFFFGGGFTKGSPTQFEQHCQYFAARGMVALTADYRVKSRHGTNPVESVLDGKSALRWVRTNAPRLGIDPNRIVASGGSAGGLIAACVGVIPSLDKQSDDTSVSYLANAMVLFNPAIMGKSVPRRPGSSTQLRFTNDIMPFHHIRAGLPPSIMFFGTQDRLLAGAKEFHEAALAKGNRCELLTWQGVGHGFFNYGRSGNRHYVETLRAADKFLASLGYTSGEPTIQGPVE